MLSHLLYQHVTWLGYNLLLGSMVLNRPPGHSWQVEHKPGGRGRGREWATLGVHPLSWLLSNNRLEKVPFVSVPHTSSNRLLLSNQDKGCTPSVAHSLALPLGPALINLWTITWFQYYYEYCWNGYPPPIPLTLTSVDWYKCWSDIVC